MKQNLYEPQVYQDCLARIDKLTPESRRKWGSMTVAQMLAHCAEIQEVSNGKELRNTPWLVKLFRGMIRSMVLSEKPYPKGMKTHRQYLKTSECDFEAEKKRLLAALEKFADAAKSPASQPTHPLLGKMTPEEKGWAVYKHLDHHLRQFGV